MTARRKRPNLKAKAEPAKASTTTKVTFLLDADLVAELRAASLDVPPRSFGGTLSALVERAVRSELKGLRRKWNEGEPFKPRGHVQARRGRPPKE
jgi:post-segregation antitoxin (ccd killing protein)